MIRLLVLTAAAALLTSSTLPAAEASTAQAARKQLPQTHAYQKTLRTHLATLKEADFTPPHKPLSVVPVEMNDDEKLRMWVLSLAPPAVGRKRNYSSVMIKPALFTLEAIEGPAAILRPPAHPEPLIDLADFDYPGNPYFNAKPLRMRAFVLVAVDLMMTDQLLDAASEPDRPTLDQLSMAVARFAYVYPGVREVLPDEVREAYLAGLKRLTRHMLDRGLKGIPIRPPGIYTRTAPALALAAKALNDAAIAKEAEAYVRPIFTEPEFFRPAGYFPAGGTLDSFNGISNHYALFAGLGGDWPFVRDALDKSSRLRAHLTLPEPDGTLVGPSHMAALTSAETAHEQWDSKVRVWNAALLTDEAASLTTMPTEDELRNAPTAVVGEINFQLQELSWAPGGLDPAPWTQQSSGMLVNFAWRYYPKGYAARRAALDKQPAELPVRREGDVIRTFGEDFVFRKTSSHAAILHTGAISDPSAAKPSFGFGGGTLSAFWTPSGGCAILGRGVGSWSPRSKTLKDEWRSLPSHCVLGATAEGRLFTSAHIVKPETTVKQADGNVTITVRSPLPSAWQRDEKSLAGTIHYERTFESTPGGLRVTTTLTGDGKDSIAELYEVLPVFLREASAQAKATPTAIEFQTGGRWAPATDAFTPQVTAASLTRFGSAVQITFERPCRMKLSPAEWGDTYQTRATCRNILIDMLESSGKPATVQGERRVSYAIEPATRPE